MRIKRTDTEDKDFLRLAGLLDEDLNERYGKLQRQYDQHNRVPGMKQHEAISLYKGLGYEVIEGYGPYIGDANSVCMKKAICSSTSGSGKEL